MPTWIIRTRDDNGNDEKIKVRASDAGEAIALAKIDMRNVLAIKTKWEDGMKKGYGKDPVVRHVALGAAVLYIIVNLFSTPAYSITAWTEAPAGVKVFSVGLAFVLVIAPVMFIHRKLRGVDDEKEEAAEIVDRCETRTALWFTAGMAWVFVLFGIVLGLFDLLREDLGATPFPEGLFPILALFAIAWYDPHDPHS